jgi:hypothetical protein
MSKISRRQKDEKKQRARDRNIAPWPALIRVIPESYGCIWIKNSHDSDWQPTTYKYLELPKKLEHQFDDWTEIYPPDWFNLTLDDFNQMGRELARILKDMAGADRYVEYVPLLPNGNYGAAEVIDEAG